MKFKVSAVLPTPADVYFLERDSSAFRSLVARMSNLESLEMGKTWMEGDSEVYEFITKPDIERYVPKQFKHFIPGGDLHYVDVIKYDPKEISASPYRMHVNSIPPIFSTKARIESTLTIEEETADTCRQTLEGTIHIKLIGLGPIVEKIIVDNLKQVYKQVPKIVEKWVAFRDEIMTNPDGHEVLVKGRPQNLGVPWISDKVRGILKEPLASSESNSETSSNYDESPLRADPSAESSVSYNDSSSANTSEDDSDDDVFFDAREQVSWLDMKDQVLESLGRDPKLERQLESDTRHTHELLTQYQKAGGTLKRIRIDKENHHKGHQKPAGSQLQDSHSPEPSVLSRRFSATAEYNSDLKQWQKFWDEHEVPQHKHNKELKARLANVFRIGADAGMFKEKKERKHLVPWIHRKHKSKGSQDASDPTKLAAQLSLDERSSGAKDDLNGSSSSDRSALDKAHGSGHKHLGDQNLDGKAQKGHQRKKSGLPFKGLFTKVEYEDQ